MFNAVITGKVGKVDEVKTIGNNKVKNFTVAHNYKRGDQWETIWYEAALWGARAESLTFAAGDTVSISTNEAITAQVYEGKDPQDPNKKIPKASLRVIVDQILVTPKSTGQES